MNYETAMIKLRGEVCSGVKLGLQNIKNLMEKLGSPQDKLKIIHIAGTNGKGSCTSFVNSVLVSQGYKVGMFTSPSIYNFEERIRINNKNIPSGIYNFADDQTISTNRLIEIIAETLNKKPVFWALSQNFITRAAKLGDWLKLPLNTERLRKLTENYVVSNDKIKSALGIEKLPLSAVEGLAKTIKSFKTN